MVLFMELLVEAISDGMHCYDPWHGAVDRMSCTIEQIVTVIYFEVVIVAVTFNFGN